MKFLVYLFFWCIFVTETVAATAIAPPHRVNIWQGSSSSLSDSDFVLYSNQYLGNVYTLKSTDNVRYRLMTYDVRTNTGGLNMANKYLASVPIGSYSYQRLSEIGFPQVGQCVAFAKAMTDAPSSPNWYRGTKLMDLLTPVSISGYQLKSWMPTLVPGTMIAHFGSIGSKSPYSDNSTDPHVAIFLSWSYNPQGYIDGIYVVDQNLVWNMTGVSGSFGGLIQKHKIPLFSTSTNKTYSASNYHIVDVH